MMNTALLPSRRPRCRRGRAAVVLAAGLLAAPPVGSQDLTRPDPLRLPAAKARQKPRQMQYQRRVRPTPAGGFYRDPWTGVRVYRLTSPEFPVPSPGWNHDYAEGGDEVSLPREGGTRSVLVRQNGGVHWLIDFHPDTGVRNARPLEGPLAPFMDVAFAFSNNPATPYLAYTSNGESIVRFDVRTMSPVPGDGWPQAESGAAWLHQSENDGLFVWMRLEEATMVAFEPSTNTKKTYVNPDFDEPRVDRAGRYVGLSMSTPPNGLVVWDWDANGPVWATHGDPDVPFAHAASLRRRWIVTDWNSPLPNQFGMFLPAVPDSAARIGGVSVSNTVHGNGSWIQHPADLDDQWALFNHYGSLRPARLPWPLSPWISPGGMVLMTARGQARLLAHSYNATDEYNFFAFAKLSSDGAYVLFTSDMNGSGRSDIFLAELPRSSAQPDAVPPTVTLTAPAAGTVSGTLTVSAAAQDGVRMAMVRFMVDGFPLGSEDATAPYGVSWNTWTESVGPHVLTAVAWDTAGNSAVSVPVVVNVER
jgi:hypothetical protein